MTFEEYTRTQDYADAVSFRRKRERRNKIVKILLMVFYAVALVGCLAMEAFDEEISETVGSWAVICFAFGMLAVVMALSVISNYLSNSSVGLYDSALFRGQEIIASQIEWEKFYENGNLTVMAEFLFDTGTYTKKSKVRGVRLEGANRQQSVEISAEDDCTFAFLYGALTVGMTETCNNLLAQGKMLENAHLFFSLEGMAKMKKKANGLFFVRKGKTTFVGRSAYKKIEKLRAEDARRI